MASIEEVNNRLVELETLNVEANQLTRTPIPERKFGVRDVPEKQRQALSDRTRGQVALGQIEQERQDLQKAKAQYEEQKKQQDAYNAQVAAQQKERNDWTIAQNLVNSGNVASYQIKDPSVRAKFEEIARGTEYGDIVTTGTITPARIESITSTTYEKPNVVPGFTQTYSTTTVTIPKQPEDQADSILNQALGNIQANKVTKEAVQPTSFVVERTPIQTAGVTKFKDSVAPLTTFMNNIEVQMAKNKQSAFNQKLESYITINPKPQPTYPDVPFNLAARGLINVGEFVTPKSIKESSYNPKFSREASTKFVADTLKFAAFEPLMTPQPLYIEGTTRKLTQLEEYGMLGKGRRINFKQIQKNIEITPLQEIARTKDIRSFNQFEFRPTSEQVYPFNKVARSLDLNIKPLKGIARTKDIKSFSQFELRSTSEQIYPFNKLDLNIKPLKSIARTKDIRSFNQFEFRPTSEQVYPFNKIIEPFKSIKLQQGNVKLGTSGFGYRTPDIYSRFELRPTSEQVYPFNKALRNLDLNIRPLKGIAKVNEISRLDVTTKDIYFKLRIPERLNLINPLKRPQTAKLYGIPDARLIAAQKYLGFNEKTTYPRTITYTPKELKAINERELFNIGSRQQSVLLRPELPRQMSAYENLNAYERTTEYSVGKMNRNNGIVSVLSLGRGFPKSNINENFLIKFNEKNFLQPRTSALVKTKQTPIEKEIQRTNQIERSINAEALGFNFKDLQIPKQQQILRQQERTKQFQIQRQIFEEPRGFIIPPFYLGIKSRSFKQPKRSRKNTFSYGFSPDFTSALFQISEKTTKKAYIGNIKSGRASGFGLSLRKLPKFI